MGQFFDYWAEQRASPRLECGGGAFLRMTTCCVDLSAVRNIAVWLVCTAVGTTQKTKQILRAGVLQYVDLATRKTQRKQWKARADPVPIGNNLTVTIFDERCRAAAYRFGLCWKALLQLQYHNPAAAALARGWGLDL